MEINLGGIKEKDYKEQRYGYVGEFCEGLALVKHQKTELYGYINEEYVEQIPCQFKQANDFSEGLGLVYTDTEKYFIDTTGKIALAGLDKYNHVKPFKNNRAVVDIDKHNFGYIDRTGKEVIPCQFYKAWDFSEDLAIVDTRDLSFLMKPSRKNDVLGRRFPQQKLRVIDLQGNIQDRFIGNYKLVSTGGFYNGLTPVLIYGRYSEATASHKMIRGFVDKTGKVYDDEETVEKLKTLYYSESLYEVTDSIVDNNRLYSYCSKITLLGQTFEICANSSEELIEKKKQFYTSLTKEIDKFKKTCVAEKNPKQRVKKMETKKAEN